MVLQALPASHRVFWILRLQTEVPRPYQKFKNRASRIFDFSLINPSYIIDQVRNTLSKVLRKLYPTIPIPHFQPLPIFTSEPFDSPALVWRPRYTPRPPRIRTATPRKTSAFLLHKTTTSSSSLIVVEILSTILPSKPLKRRSSLQRPSATKYKLPI
jgi:hypothetical protein